MFRARVAAQGFTVIAMVAGSMYYSKDREKSKELRKLKEEHDAEEKRQKWIRELEVRDEEDKAMKARLGRKWAAAGADTAAEPVPSDEGKSEGTGGVLGQMGLWSKGEKAAEEATKAETVTEPDLDKKKKGNPKSSLGAINEVLLSKKKEDGTSDNDPSNK